VSLESVPVVAVTLTEDRATVTRRARLSLPAGATTVTIAGVSPLIVDDSIRAAVEGASAEVVRASAARSWAAPTPKNTANHAVHAMLDDLEAQVWATSRHTSRAAERADDAIERFRTISAAAGRAAVRSTADPDHITQHLSLAADRVVHTADTLSSALDRSDHLGRELERMAGAHTPDRGAAQLHATLSVHLDLPEAGDVVLTVGYIVPSALWRPAYEATLERDAQGHDHLQLRLVATAWQRTGEDWDDVEVVLSTARPSASSQLPPLARDVLQAREKSRAEARQIDASFRDQALQSATLTKGGSGALPGVDDGGEARVFRPTERVSLPSDGRARRLVVASLRTPASVTRRCLPAHLPAVLHTASAQNTLTVDGSGAVPLMAGPVLLVRADGTCVGTGRLPYVAPGERFELGFGSEDDVVVRHRHGRRAETRFARSDRVWFTSTTTLTSTSGSSVHLEVHDRVPVSDLPEVTIHLAPDRDGAPRRVGPDPNGHVRWQVHLAPGQTLELEVAFAIDKPDRVQLPDPW